VGLDDLRAALRDQVRAAGPGRDLGRPRLWVDRSFLIQGAGVIVTGTLVDGPVRRETPLSVYPQQREVRIRSLQSHERSTDAVPPGTRTAVNFTGAERGDVPRGSMLGPPGAFVVTRTVLATVEPVRSRAEPLPDRGAYHLHIGTATVPVRLRFLDRGTALLRLGSEVAMTMGDRFILRETGRRAVVGGGRVIDPAPVDRPTAGDIIRLRDVVDAAPGERATALLAVHGAMALQRIAAASGGGRAEGVVAGTVVLTEERAHRYLASAVDETERFQAANPMRLGIPKQTLGSLIGVDQATLDALLESTAALAAGGGVVHTPHFRSSFDDPAWEPARRTLDASLAVPRASQLGLDPESLHARIRSGDLIRVADDLVYLPEQIDRITDDLAGLDEPFTVGEFRDRHGLSRRQAVPLLEWLDAQLWTRRDGDMRTVRRRPSD
jgi:selenocysteine-specific elongation factor